MRSISRYGGRDLVQVNSTAQGRAICLQNFRTHGVVVLPCACSVSERSSSSTASGSEAQCPKASIACFASPFTLLNVLLEMQLDMRVSDPRPLGTRVDNDRWSRRTALHGASAVADRHVNRYVSVEQQSDDFQHALSDRPWVPLRTNMRIFLVRSPLCLAVTPSSTLLFQALMQPRMWIFLAYVIVHHILISFDSKMTWRRGCYRVPLSWQFCFISRLLCTRETK